MLTAKFKRRLKNFVLKLTTATAAAVLLLMFMLRDNTMPAWQWFVICLICMGWIALFLAANPQLTCLDPPRKERRTAHEQP